MLKSRGVLCLRVMLLSFLTTILFFNLFPGVVSSFLFIFSLFYLIFLPHHNSCFWISRLYNFYYIFPSYPPSLFFSLLPTLRTYILYLFILFPRVILFPFLSSSVFPPLPLLLELEVTLSSFFFPQSSTSSFALINTSCAVVVSQTLALLILNTFPVLLLPCWSIRILLWYSTSFVIYPPRWFSPAMFSSACVVKFPPRMITGVRETVKK